MNCSPPGSCVHGISQARIMEWVAISYSRASSQFRDQTHIFCTGRWILYHWATRKAPVESSTGAHNYLSVLGYTSGFLQLAWIFSSTVKMQTFCWTGHEQQTGSKLGKECVKAVCCHPAYLTYMQSISCEMLDWMKHKLESTLLEEISITSDKQVTPHLWQKAKKN